jgi:ribonuclease P protein component
MMTTHFEVRASESLFSQGRIGVIVPKFGNTIVDRNRLRRRIREIARTVLLPTLGNRDILIKALPSAYKSDFQAMREELAGISGGTSANDR